MTKRICPPLRVVIAGGGTGGHLFPGIAVAQEFLARNLESAVLFVSTGSDLEISVLSEKGFPLKRITVEGFKGRGRLNQVKSILKIPVGIFEAVRILKAFSPDLVFGVGSYSAGPVVMGAWLLRIKTALHEQNILPGITNRILSRFADRVFVSFETTRQRLGTTKSILTGNPIRADLRPNATVNENGESLGDPAKDGFSVLILGGSQGAHDINVALVAALDHLRNTSTLLFIHQTGQSDERYIEQAYRKKGVRAEVSAFFHEMVELYRRADLVICRAGATTIAEITAIGKGVIFIPFPFATDNHQVVNARALTDKGAAEMIEQKNLNGKRLAERIDYFFSHPEALTSMAGKARSLGRPEAAADIVDQCYQLFPKSRAA